MDLDRHLEEFARAFCLPSKRERWCYLLAPKRRAKAFKHSSKLMDHVEPKYRTRIEEGTAELDGDTQGVFFDFLDEPEVMSWRDVLDRGDDDAIFSIKPGAFAVLLSHEGDMWLHRR